MAPPWLPVAQSFSADFVLGRGVFALMNDSLALVWPTLGLMSRRSQNLHANKLPVEQGEHDSFYPVRFTERGRGLLLR